MAKRQRKATGGSPATGTKQKIEQYEHKGKTRVNNPPVGLVTPHTEPPESSKKTYAYDPHIDPSLQWAGKAERLSFEVPTVSLHVHERIDPRTIIEAVRRKNGNGHNGGQLRMFETASENPPLRDAIDFYRYPHDWTNRLIAGDSMLVMNSLLEKEGMAGKVQMVYIDPPYGISYRSNFQAFVNERDVKNKDDNLTQEPETIKAFRDTWELGIHSYLAHLKDRLLLAHKLLGESGCCFVQINAENCHYIVSLMSEVFGPANLVANIVFRKKSIPLGAKYLETMHDHLVLFAKDRSQLKYRHLYETSDVSAISSHGPYALYPNGRFEKIDPTDFQSPAHVSGTRYYRPGHGLRPEPMAGAGGLHERFATEHR
jgi:adenine-specific DNA-methyltransferase